VPKVSDPWSWGMFLKVKNTINRENMFCRVITQIKDFFLKTKIKY
jgi:hypothetical protein